MELVNKHGLSSHRTIRIIFLANVRIDDIQGELRKAIFADAINFLSSLVKDSPNDPAKKADLGGCGWSQLGYFPKWLGYFSQRGGSGGGS